MLWARTIHFDDMRPSFSVCDKCGRVCVCLSVVQSLSRVQFLATPQTASCQASVSFAVSCPLNQ